MHETLEMHLLPGAGYSHEEKSAHMSGKKELAEAYIPMQVLDGVYPPEEGLKMGTAFPCLSKPYKGWRQWQEC